MQDRIQSKRNVKISQLPDGGYLFENGYVRNRIAPEHIEYMLNWLMFDRWLDYYYYHKENGENKSLPSQIVPSQDLVGNSRFCF